MIFARYWIIPVLIEQDFFSQEFISFFYRLFDIESDIRLEIKAGISKKNYIMIQV